MALLYWVGVARFELDIFIQPIPIQFGAKYYFLCKQLPPAYNIAHEPCLYVLKLFICQKGFLSFAFLIFIMRLKVQLTLLDVDYQRKERAKTRARLDELKKPRVIPREKSSANFSFKSVAFNLPTLTQLGGCRLSGYFLSHCQNHHHSLSPCLSYCSKVVSSPIGC